MAAMAELGAEQADTLGDYFDWMEKMEEVLAGIGLPVDD